MGEHANIGAIGKSCHMIHLNSLLPQIFPFESELPKLSVSVLLLAVTFHRTSSVNPNIFKAKKICANTCPLSGFGYTFL